MADSARRLDTQPRIPAVQGLVDNFASGRIFGWAWDPSRPEERVRVALRLDGEVVAETVAEAERADLRKAGVGDGRHAFDIVVPPEVAARRAELSVTARAADGRETRLPLRAARRPPALAPVPPGADTAAARAEAAGDALRERLEALARIVPAEGAAPAPAVTALEGRAETLEAWCLRLDERLASLSAAAPDRAAPRRGLDRWQLVLGAVLLLVVAAALAVTWIGPAALLGAWRG